MRRKIRFQQWLRKLYSLRWPDTKIDKQWDVVFLSGTARPLKKNGKAYERTADPIIEDLYKLGLKCLSICPAYTDLDVKTAFSETALINRKVFVSRIIDKIFKTSLEIELYKRIFRKTGAKYVFMFNNRKNIVVAAHSLNLITVEPLHSFGIYANPMPWKWGERNFGELPRFILTNDEVSTQSLLPLEEKGVKIMEIESPLLKRFTIPKFRNEIPEDWLKLNADISNKKVIIVALQWGYSGETQKLEGILENGLWPKGFEELFEKTKNDVLWGLRLHPLQLTQREYKHHFNYIKKISSQFSNVEWEEFSNKPLPTILANADGLITMCSTCCSDAAAMNVPAMALCPTLRNDGVQAHWFEELVEMKLLVKKEYSEESVLSWINTLDKSKTKIMIENDKKWEKFCNKLIK